MHSQWNGLRRAVDNGRLGMVGGHLTEITFLFHFCHTSKSFLCYNQVTHYRTGAPFVVPSAMSKAGVEIMTKSLSTEWGKYGIRLNVIAPGPFPTEVRIVFGRMQQRRSVTSEIIYATCCRELSGG